MTAGLKLQQEGIEQGIKKEKVTIAKSMLSKGLSTELIEDVTRLSKEAIEKLREE